MSDLISRQAAIRWIKAECNPYGKPTLDYETSCRIMEHLERMPSAEPKTPSNGSITSMNTEKMHVRTMDDLISKKDATTIPVMPKEHREYQTMNLDDAYEQGWYDCQKCIEDLPSAQPEQRYTEEELRVFKHGISLSLLSKRSSQHWCYDEDTATEIKFLERLYEKVSANMRGGQNE